MSRETQMRSQFYSWITKGRCTTGRASSGSLRGRCQTKPAAGPAMRRVPPHWVTQRLRGLIRLRCAKPCFGECHDP